MSWSTLGEWWLDELGKDDTYESVITPLLTETLTPAPGLVYLDLGCGEGRVMRALSAVGAETIGVELNERLAAIAGRAVVSRLPSIPMRDESVDGAYTVLVLEHLEDHHIFFAEAARVVRHGGVLALVMNHPVWTAPNSSPIQDVDGEVLLRPGAYFATRTTEMAIGDHMVTFFHRSMADLLTSAAQAGWSLQRVIERPHHDIDQPGIPRLLACRWRSLNDVLWAQSLPVSSEWLC